MHFFLFKFKLSVGECLVFPIYEYFTQMNILNSNFFMQLTNLLLNLLMIDKKSKKVVNAVIQRLGNKK